MGNNKRDGPSEPFELILGTVKLTLVLTSSKASATLKIVRAESTDSEAQDGFVSPNPAEIVSALSPTGIRWVPELERVLLDALVELEEEGEVEALVAEGKEPTRGVDGSVEWLVQPEERKETVHMVGDTADFRDIRTIPDVQVGDAILAFSNPTQGEDGIDVFGEPIAAIAGQPLPNRFSPDLEVDVEKGVVVATRAGRLGVREDGYVWIDPVYRVEGDVNFNTGNIVFEGDVVVSGNVLDDFEIRAAKDVTIYGSVYAAKVYAGGNIVIHEGGSGHHRAEIVAKGSITAKYLDEVTARAGGDLNVYHELISSHVRVGGRIISPGGSIMGGDAVALRGFEVRNLGSTLLVPTEVVVGFDPEVELRIRDARVKANALSRQIEQIYLKTKRYADKPSLLESAQESIRRTVTALLNTMQKLREEKASVDAVLENLMAQTVPVNEIKASVTKDIFPHVKVTIGKTTTHFLDVISNPGALTVDDEDRRIVSTAELEAKKRAKQREASAKKPHSARASNSRLRYTR